LKRIIVLLALVVLAAGAALAHGKEEHIMGTVSAMTASSITVQTGRSDNSSVGQDRRHMAVRIFLPSTVVPQEGMNDSLSENEDHSRIELQCNRILILRQEPTYKIR
jgi:hypothetical protein